MQNAVSGLFTCTYNIQGLNSGIYNRKVQSAAFKPPLMTSPIAKSAALQDLRTGDRWFHPRLPIFFPRIDDSHCNRIHSSLTAAHCFDNG